MPNERKAKIFGEIVLGENCNFYDLAEEIFACCEKYNAVPNFRIYEILPNEEEIRQNEVTKIIVENALLEKKHYHL